MHPIPMKGGDEYDALTKWRKYLRFHAGARARIKRGYWQRARRIWRDEGLHEAIEDAQNMLQEQQRFDRIECG